MIAVNQQHLPANSPMPSSVYESQEPILLKGFVDQWPAVKSCDSISNAANYLSTFWQDKPLTVYVGDKSIDGRFFYNEDFSGFNFRSGTATLPEVMQRLNESNRSSDIHSIYVGSTPVDQWLPGFRSNNDVKLPDPNPLASFWLGSGTRVSAHFDFPDNLACVVAGTRKFTLFPPDQLANLYVGPLDNTPSGQAISLVDFKSPDFTKYPKFADALEVAQVAELSPGDALFIPSMWWHHVEALEDFNLLVNYWWCSTPGYLGAPTAALMHSLLAIRDLPQHQKDAWRNLFDHYIFSSDEHTAAHIPNQGQGCLAPFTEQSARQLRADIVNRLNS